MPPTTASDLDEAIREDRPEQREKLVRLAELRHSIARLEGEASEMRDARLRLWRELRAEGVSWVDIGRASGLAGETVAIACRRR